MEEELQNQKLTNQMFVQAKEDETSLNAATFISVVCFMYLNIDIPLILRNVLFCRVEIS